MCFSVTASFTASIALITCSIAALRRAHEKKLKMIAAIPLLFGLQQFAEGMVWLSFLYPRFESIRMFAAYIFLTCAGVLWPLWIPIATARFEGAHRYKRYLPSLIAGGFCSLAFVVYVLFYSISVTAKCNVIYYFGGIDGHQSMWAHSMDIIASVLYVVATIVPFFIARNTMLWFLGALVAVAYGVSYVAYYEAFASVWCFFAAIISLLVYGFICLPSHKIKK